MSNDYNHWIHTAKPVRMFIVDYRLSILLIFFLIHIRFWVFALLIAFFVFFFVLEMKKMNIVAASKRFRSFLAGNTRKIK
jgi:hypothetical protein